MDILEDGYALMKILYHPKSLMQRHRSLLHILDSLIERGHEIFIYKRVGKLGIKNKTSTDDLYNPLDYTIAPWDVDRVGPDTLKYLARHFGIEVRHLDKIHWVERGKDKVSVNIVLATDRIPIKVKRNWEQINLPYNEFYCRKKGKEFLVGNGMCEEVYNRSKIKTNKGQLLILHPGGGRNIISPLRKHIPKQQVIENNIALFNQLLIHLPENITKIIVKSHPAPYINCDYKALNFLVKPQLVKEVEVVDNNLIDHLCKSEFILSFGSSTVIWLLGSNKQWVNLLLGMRDHRLWSNRGVWPQNIQAVELNSALSDYKKYFNWSKEWREAFEERKELHRLPCTKNIIDVIEGGYK